MSVRRTLAGLLIGAGLFLWDLPSLGAQSPAQGTLYIVGGGPQPAALVQEFVDLAGGRGKARIAVFAMASEEGATSGEEKADDLRKLGATARNIWITRAQADMDSVAALLDSVTGVWFGGGDQNRLAAVLRGTKTGAAIRRRYEAGAVIGGTSAGAAVLSTPMITGDERRPGGARPDTTQNWITIDREDVITAEGFGYVTNAIVDQHFLRRRRHNRLISLVLEGPIHLGAGIDESTALIVTPDGRWRVAGASVVTIYDARHAAITPNGTLSASGIVMHVLPAGGTFDPADGAARLPAASTADAAGVRTAMEGFMTALNALDLNGMAGYFADDVTAFVPAAQPTRVEGRAALVEIFRAFVERTRPATPRLHLVPEAIEVTASATMGFVSFQIREPASHTVRRRTFIFERRDGRWLIRHLNASDLVTTP